MTPSFRVGVLCLSFLLGTALHIPGSSDGSRGIDWNQIAQSELERSLYNFPQVGIAKNVILFLGDGMGLSDVTATRFLLAQRKKQTIEETQLSFDNFPFVGLSKTHTADRQTADSAGAATAVLCGEKANFYTVGVDDRVRLYNCSDMTEDTKLKSVLTHSREAGKWTGLVTTTRVTHGTPAAAYAHSPDRNGEANIPHETAIDPEKCQDIGYQLVYGPGNDEIRVIMGGGRSKLQPCKRDQRGKCRYGEREDGKDLIKEWIQLKEKTGISHESFKFIQTKQELDTLDISKTDYLLGLFADGHMSYDHDRRAEKSPSEPSLVEMVDKAIRILQRSESGFFLFVEGGRIDQAHHKNLPYKALDETIVFAEAVQKAVELTDIEDTLIVVTADHSHVFNIAGYPDIDNDILGTYISKWEPEDKMPYTTLAYVNGPGFHAHRADGKGNVVQRKNLTGVDTTGPDVVFDAGIPIEDETHGGEDVAIYARGPMSYLFQGTHQQHYIAHALMYASCVGPNKELCEKPLPTPPTISTATTTLYHPLLLLAAFFVALGKYRA